MRTLAILPALLVGATLVFSVRPAAAWWQFVMNGPNGERQISPHFETEKECNTVLKLTEAERKAVARNVSAWQGASRKLRGVKLANSVPFPLVFNPAPAMLPGEKAGTVDVSDKETPKKPDSDADLAFLL